MSTNQTIAAFFHEMSSLMELLGEDRFRINAYAKAGRVVEELTVDLAEIGADLKRLTALNGIGKGTAEKIIEYLETGKMAAHDELLERVPPGVLPMMQIPGLGPKTVALLWKEAGIESVEQLKEKLKTDELTRLKGMGAKKLEALRKSIAFAEQAGGRVRIGQAMPLAEWLVEKLGELNSVKQVAYAGSLRRGKETIGDVDLLVAVESEAAGRAVSEAFVKLEPVADVIAQGRTKTSIRTKDGLQCDLRTVPPESFGAALMYFTGSKEHNVAMRERAIRRGMSLNEYALTRDDEPVAGRTEQEVYKALGLAWVAPEMREDRGELALAEKDALPGLIEMDDIRAELHAHTTASDGLWSIEQLAEGAAARGFHTVAVTDHSKGQFQANGLDEARLERHIREIRKVAERMKGSIRILAGSEVDILSDGRLDYPDSLLEQLDIVVASPHAALSQEPDKATDRLLRAIEHPLVTILGHPTGRLINRRAGLSPDMAKLFAAAAKRGIALEINANHYRLDLRDTHARAAIEAGVKLSINTDAHGPADLNELRYGVLTARRAGATAADVVNCLDAANLTKWLRSTRE